MTPVEFLLARLAEAEDVAHRCNDARWSTLLQGNLTMVVSAPAGDVLFQIQDEWQALQITRHDPAYVLADIAAKRAILELLTSWRHVVVEDCWYTCPAATSERDGGECCDDIRRAGGDCDCGRDHLIEQAVRRRFCQPFADHPDYDPAWSIDG